MTPLRVSGWFLLIGGLIAFAGAMTPPWKQWYAPLPDALRTIAAHPVGWRLINGGFLVGTVLCAIGFAALAFAVRGRPGATLQTAGASAFVFGALFWVLVLVYRLGTHAWAAAQFSTTGVVPPTFPPQQIEMALYFGLFAILAFSGLALSGWSALESAIAARWLARTMIVVGIIGAPVVTFIGPWMLYVPIILLGASLIRSLVA